MTSEETLVAEIAKEIVVAATDVSLRWQLALMHDESTALALPAIVFTAKYEKDGEGAPAANTDRYTLGVEMRHLRGTPADSVVDADFKSLTDALAGTPAADRPASLTAGSYFTIENRVPREPGKDGDAILRGADYTVFAQLV